MNNAPYQGQCLCGQIQYEADHISSKIGHCHCTMCRKFHGAAFSTYGQATAKAFRWLQGEELLTTYVGHNGTKRMFCRNCGSSLIFESSNNPESIEFSLATLDKSPKLTPDAHIFTDTKVAWIELDTRSMNVHQKGRP